MRRRHPLRRWNQNDQHDATNLRTGMRRTTALDFHSPKRTRRHRRHRPLTKLRRPKNVPYIQAVVEENFRWHHPVPAGVPHADDYKGYHIPKGSIIIPFFDAMRQDKRLFDAPNEFRPERWLGKSQSANFGYGRRICAGRHIARNSLIITIARMLWAFDIRPRDGQTVRVDEVEFTTGFVSAPIGVGAMFVPRSEAHARVVREAFEATEKDVARLLDTGSLKHILI
jgi:cytochrome P450